MSARHAVDVHGVFLAVTLAAGAAVVFFVALTVLAKPGGYAFELAQARRQTAEAGQLLQQPGDPYAFAADAVCHSSPETAAVALRQQLQNTAAAASVTVSNLSITPGAPDESVGNLAPVTLQFEANGGYAAVVAMLASLSKSRPELFLDTVDLKSQTSAVALKLNGRLFCLPSARP